MCNCWICKGKSCYCDICANKSKCGYAEYDLCRWPLMIGAKANG